MANTTFHIVRKASTNEWVVVVRINGKRCEDRCYYTDDRGDAIDTQRFMEAEEERRSAPQAPADRIF